MKSEPTRLHEHPATCASGGVHPHVTGSLALGSFASMAAAWRWLAERCEIARQRRALAKLDSDALRDIGLTPADVRAETAKPIWRD